LVKLAGSLVGNTKIEKKDGFPWLQNRGTLQQADCGQMFATLMIEKPKGMQGVNMVGVMGKHGEIMLFRYWKVGVPMCLNGFFKDGHKGQWLGSANAARRRPRQKNNGRRS